MSETGTCMTSRAMSIVLSSWVSAEAALLTSVVLMLTSG